MANLLKELLRSTGGRFCLICFFILLLNIPLLMVQNIVESRARRFDGVSEEINKAWGGAQRIVGPVLSVPVEKTFEETVYDKDKKAFFPVQKKRTDYHAVLPSELNVDLEMIPEMRHQGIYDVLVYKAAVKITGRFTADDFKDLEKEGSVFWRDARLNIGMKPSSVRGDIEMSFAGKPIDLYPSTQWPVLEGASSPVNIRKTLKEYPFSLSFSYNAGAETALAPVGKKSVFNVSSPWPHPLFRGEFRPDAPEISADGFSAGWVIPYIARGYSQTLGEQQVRLLNNKTAQVSLFNVTPVYKQALRLCGYGIMFIALTFMMMFVMERRSGRKFGAIQYVISGLAVALFFLTVLALAEHLPFSAAYVMAAGIATLMISAYVFGAQRSGKTAGVYAVSTGVLYALLYVMLCSADYALLIGTIILLCALSVVMKATAHVNEEESKDA